MDGVVHTQDTSPQLYLSFDLVFQQHVHNISCYIWSCVSDMLNRRSSNTLGDVHLLHVHLHFMGARRIRAFPFGVYIRYLGDVLTMGTSNIFGGDNILCRSDVDDHYQ